MKIYDHAALQRALSGLTGATAADTKPAERPPVPTRHRTAWIAFCGTVAAAALVLQVCSYVLESARLLPFMFVLSAPVLVAGFAGLRAAGWDFARRSEASRSPMVEPTRQLRWLASAWGRLPRGVKIATVVMICVETVAPFVGVRVSTLLLRGPAIEPLFVRAFLAGAVMSALTGLVCFAYLQPESGASELR